MYTIDLNKDQSQLLNDFMDHLKEKDPKASNLEEVLDDFVSKGDDAVQDAVFQDQANRREAFREAFLEDQKRNRKYRQYRQFNLSQSPRRVDH
jgi:hypothetical protein